MKLKKICSLFAILTLCLVMLTGCVRSTIETVVKKDGSMDVTVVYAVSEEANAALGGVMNKINKENLENDGVHVYPYSDGEYVGFTIIMRDAPLEEGLENAGTEDSPIPNVTFTRSGLCDYTLEMRKQEMYQQQASAEQLKESGDAIKEAGGYMNFVLELPCEPTECNANIVEGNRMTWDLLDMPEETIYVKFHYNFLLHRYWPYLAIGAGGLLFLILMIVLIRKACKKPKEFSYFQE